MKLKTVQINNFRLLEDCSIRLNDETTVLVGKNNSGKTSFSCIFEMFLNDKNFSFDDFSINCHSNFISAYKEYIPIKNDEKKVEDFFISIDSKIPAIKMLLDIEYDEKDNWSNIRPLLTTLEPTNILQILFQFCIKEPKAFFENLHNDMQKVKITKKNENKKIIECVSEIFIKYFKRIIKPFSADVQTEEIRISDVNKIIGNYFIAAQRNVEDGSSQTSSKLAPVFQREYKNCEQKKNIDGFADVEFANLNNEMDKANSNIDKKLTDFFKSFTNSFATFGYPNVEGADIILKSNVTATNLFSGIRLFYKDKEHLLPEKYNGLGYSNLIYIISEILCFKSILEENPTDLNLIFIEEPEAHMHPQLQNTFILKLNQFLKENNLNAQIIISTHSPHIVSNANFESIRYFSRNDGNVTIKDLLEFKTNIETKIKDDESDDDEFDIDTIQFLKQYITLVKCDMFFADKIILIEGLCERLLMPLFIKKTDKEICRLPKFKNLRALSEQYISVIEIGGAYMHKFKEFLEFLEIKTLIITDIDCCYTEEKLKEDGTIDYKEDGCTPKMTSPQKHEILLADLEKLVSTNQTLVQWVPQKKKIKDLVFVKFDFNNASTIAVAYQTNWLNSRTKIKCGRTFEEAFIIENNKYILQHKKKLSSIKNNIKDYANDDGILNKSYSIYSYIDANDKKTDFAFDLMYVHPDEWDTPRYIKEGLFWLAK